MGIPFLHVYALENVSLQLQWQHQFEFAGFYAAREKGFYEAEGLDVNFYEPSGEGDTVQEVLDGNKTYGIGYSSLLMNYLNGKPLVLLANIFKHSALVLVAQKEISRPADLKGKRIMGSHQELINSGITMMFYRFDMTADDFEIVPVHHSIVAFMQHEVDAMAAFITNEPFLLNEIDAQYNILNPTSYGSQFYDVNLFTSRQEIQQHPKRTAAFVRASIKGWKYALKHSDEMIDLILEKYNTQHKSKAALKYEAEIIKSLVLPNIYPVGSMDCKVLKQMATDFIDSGLKVKNRQFDIDGLLFNKHCTAKNNAVFTIKQQHYLETKKEIKVCIDPNWMPFEAIKQGRYIGMSEDFMRLFESYLEIPVTLVPTTNWTQSLEYIKKHRCDILALAMSSPERSSYLNFTSDYLQAPIVIATTNDKFFIENINKLNHKKLGIVKNHAFSEELRLNHPEIDFVIVDSVDEGLKAVAKGRLYGFIGNLNSVAYYIRKNYSGYLKVAGQFDKTLKLSVAVKNDDPVLLDIFNRIINNMDEKARQNVLNEWLNINVDSSIDYSIYWKSLAVFSVLLMFLFYRYRIVSQYNTHLQALNKKLELLSIIDPLTKLYNRRYIDNCIQDSFNLARRYNTPFSMIILDIDDFKQINDTHGHSVGDTVLQDFAAILLAYTRKNDTISRWGGEEFLIICQQSDIKAAQQVAEKLRLIIAGHEFNKGLSITASFGVAAFQQKDNPDNLLNRADHALYQAKDKGKNRVVAV